ncbi:glycosyltransferase family 25 protein [Thiomicrorhabdus arctica]|uniref:glycosyltransferase family 25 protein n=1 Tax=Thiomicrorhabdus arctica TaxID=131540 RepID=UPI0012FE6C7F|nr:glycosyltransferase family 25 protein [Thiomicrorhabdus arctica]
MINLERNPERLAFISHRLQSLGIDFERINAVDGYSFSEEYLDEFRQNSLRPTGWIEGQIGCFLSHRKAWQQIMDGDEEYGVIFEDDLHIADSLGKVISDMTWIPAEADVVRLENTTNWVKLKKVGEVDQRDVCVVENDSWCAGAYILSKKTAAFLVNQEPKLWLPADTYLFAKSLSEVANALNIFQINPVLTCQDKYSEGVIDSNELMNFDSEIEVDQLNAPPKPTLIESIKQTIAPSLGYSRTVFKN